MRKIFTGVLVGTALLVAPMAVISTTLIATATNAMAADTAPGIPAASLHLRKAGGNVQEFKNDAKGNFMLGMLPPGDYAADIEGLSWSWGVSQARSDQAMHVVLTDILVSSIQASGGSGQKPVASSQQSVRLGQTMTVKFTVPADSASRHSYVGTVTLLK